MEQTNVRRRNFLVGLGLGGLASATALLSGRQAGASEAGEGSAPDTPRAGTGYRLSEHVQTYYRKARL